LGILITAVSGSLEIRRRRLSQLRDIEELVIEEAQEEVIVEEALSLLFQLEVFGEIPAMGAVSGAVLNVAMMNRVDVTSRRIFQERWLQHAGTVTVIRPATAHPRALAGGLAGAIGRAAYEGCYYFGFGAALPIYLAAAVVRPMNQALTRGLRDRASAVNRGRDRSRAAVRTAVDSVVPARRRRAPAPA
jgi:hypothetical protein